MWVGLFVGCYGGFVSAAQRWASKSSKGKESSYLKGEDTSARPIFDGDVNTLGQLIDAASEVMPDKDLFHHVEAYDKWTYKEARVSTITLYNMQIN